MLTAQRKQLVRRDRLVVVSKKGFSDVVSGVLYQQLPLIAVVLPLLATNKQVFATASPAHFHTFTLLGYVLLFSLFKREKKVNGAFEHFC